MEKIPFGGVKSFIFYPREQPCLLACRVWVSSLLAPLVLKEPAPTGSHRGLTRHCVSWEDLPLDGLRAGGSGEGAGTHHHLPLCWNKEQMGEADVASYPLSRSVGS